MLTDSNDCHGCLQDKQIRRENIMKRYLNTLQSKKQTRLVVSLGALVLFVLSAGAPAIGGGR